MGSDHLPIVIHLFNKLVIPSGNLLNNNIRSQKRPKLCLKNFDKELFPIIIPEKINSPPSMQSSKDPLQKSGMILLFYCSLMAGAIIYDGLGNKKEYIKDKLITFSFKFPIRNKNKSKEVHDRPWWDKDCAIIINKRKWAHKKLAKCPSRDNMSNYRNISTLVGKEL